MLIQFNKLLNFLLFILYFLTFSSITFWRIFKILLRILYALTFYKYLIALYNTQLNNVIHTAKESMSLGEEVKRIFCHVNATCLDSRSRWLQGNTPRLALAKIQSSYARTAMSHLYQRKIAWDDWSSSFRFLQPKLTGFFLSEYSTDKAYFKMYLEIIGH